MFARWLFTVLGLGLTLAAGSPHFTQAQIRSAPPAIGTVRLDAHRILGTPHTYRNLTLWPVYDPTARSTDTYLTLDEGLKQGVVKVQESKNGADVNTLYVTNHSSKSLYLMAGEVVLGGQQDRCLARDGILASGKTHVPITVFCVEHGRWVGYSDFEASASAVASADIRLQAQDSTYVAERAMAGTPAGLGGLSAHASGRITRIPANAPPALSASASISTGQQQVWAKVARKNARFKALSPTGTYRDTLNLTAGDARKSVPAYVKPLSASLGNNPHLVGVVACVNGNIAAADIFSDPALFRKLWPKLLRSYAADAVETAPVAGRKQNARKVTADQVRAFYTAATDAKTSTENRSDTSATLRLESSAATAYRLMPVGKAAMGSIAVPVHETLLHK